MAFIKVRSYLSGNSTSSHYKDQLVDAVTKVLAVNSEKKKYETHKYAVGKMQRYWRLNMVVHIVASGL
jgi:hypothetical protein